ncbi:hypothetical protein HJA91_17985 [Rhizobium binae]|nr:hypothetical protein [Rhizobium binae]
MAQRENGGYEQGTSDRCGHPADRHAARWRQVISELHRLLRRPSRACSYRGTDLRDGSTLCRWTTRSTVQPRRGTCGAAGRYHRRDRRGDAPSRAPRHIRYTHCLHGRARSRRRRAGEGCGAAGRKRHRRDQFRPRAGKDTDQYPQADRSQPLPAGNNGGRRRAGHIAEPLHSGGRGRGTAPPDGIAKGGRGHRGGLRGVQERRRRGLAVFGGATHQHSWRADCRTRNVCPDANDVRTGSGPPRAAAGLRHKSLKGVAADGRNVDRILKGAKPGDMPIERVMQPELIVSLRGAERIGIPIPPEVLAAADRVIA